MICTGRKWKTASTHNITSTDQEQASEIENHIGFDYKGVIYRSNDNKFIKTGFTASVRARRSDDRRWLKVDVALCLVAVSRDNRCVVWKVFLLACLGAKRDLSRENQFPIRWFKHSIQQTCELYGFHRELEGKLIFSTQIGYLFFFFVRNFY